MNRTLTGKVVSPFALVLNFCMLFSLQGRNCVDTNADACLLYALNPKTSETICLERFRLPGRSV